MVVQHVIVFMREGETLQSWDEDMNLSARVTVSILSKNKTENITTQISLEIWIYSLLHKKIISF